MIFALINRIQCSKSDLEIIIEKFPSNVSDVVAEHLKGSYN